MKTFTTRSTWESKTSTSESSLRLRVHCVVIYRLRRNPRNKGLKTGFQEWRNETRTSLLDISGEHHPTEYSRWIQMHRRRTSNRRRPRSPLGVTRPATVRVRYNLLSWLDTNVNLQKSKTGVDSSIDHIFQKLRFGHLRSRLILINQWGWSDEWVIELPSDTTYWSITKEWGI